MKTLDVEDDLDVGRRQGLCGACLHTCFAWASFLIWTVVILLLILGIGFYAFVQSNLPKVAVHRLDIYRLNVSTPTKKDKDTTVTLDVEFRVNVTNSNEKISLVYKGFDVRSNLEAFDLPRVRVKGFRQGPRRWNDLNIRPEKLWMVANEDNANELKENAKRHEMVFTVTMNGKIEFWYNGRMMSELRLRILCQDVEQAKVDDALAPKCLVKLSPFR